MRPVIYYAKSCRYSEYTGENALEYLNSAFNLSEKGIKNVLVANGMDSVLVVKTYSSEQCFWSIWRVQGNHKDYMEGELAIKYHQKEVIFGKCTMRARSRRSTTNELRVR